MRFFLINHHEHPQPTNNTYFCPPPGGGGNKKYTPASSHLLFIHQNVELLPALGEVDLAVDEVGVPDVHERQVLKQQNCFRNAANFFFLVDSPLRGGQEVRGCPLKKKDLF